MRLLIVTILTGNIRLSLITLELIIGRVFAILAILRSIRMVVFRFLPHLSGFGCHFKAFDIILADQPIIFCTSLCFPLSNQLFNQSTLFFWTMSGTIHFTQIFREKCTVHLLPSSLNKGHLFDTSFFTEWFPLIKLRTAIILNTSFSINDSITQNQQHACHCHDCWVCWFSITLPHLLEKYLPCRNTIFTKNSNWSG